MAFFSTPLLLETSRLEAQEFFPLSVTQSAPLFAPFYPGRHSAGVAAGVLFIFSY
jgi:hypothetical protein